MKILLKPSNFIAKFKDISGKIWSIKSFVWVVIVPMIIISIYYLFIASDRYVSESKITIKQANLDTNTSMSPLSLLIGGNPLSREDAFYLKEYIYSFDMLNVLDRKLNLRQAYQDRNADFFSRLYSKASQEDFLEYYRDHVEIVFDEISSIMTIRTEGFTPELAKNINELILRQSELFVNEISNKIAADQVVFVDGQVKRANNELQKSKNQLIRFQNKNNIIDPAAQAVATSGIVTSLESSLATQEAELNNLLTYMHESAPQVITVKSKIAAIRKQIAKEKTLIAGEGNDPLNKLTAQYSDLKLAIDFSSDVYKATLAALEKSRLDAAKKIKSVVTISTPTLPEEAEYPRKIYILSSFFVILLLSYGIIRLVIAIIREHSDESF